MTEKEELEKLRAEVAWLRQVLGGIAVVAKEAVESGTDSPVLQRAQEIVEKANVLLEVDRLAGETARLASESADREREAVGEEVYRRTPR